jgi:5-methylcytosine-specific restriction endonuclease McrA
MFVRRTRQDCRVERADLEQLIAVGLTQREIAAVCGCGQSTVRYWLSRFGLRTKPAERAATARIARAAGLKRIELECAKHGRREFVLDREGFFRCPKCRTERVAQRRRTVKEQLVREAGGSCVLCGYSRHPAALEFHHVDPAAKGFAVGADGLTRALDRMREEAAKCVLLCSNCHAEVEVGFAALPPDIARRRG